MRTPIMIEDIVTPQPGLKVYPPDTDVFAEPDAALARHLHPLVSIDLATVDPSWQGWIHLLSPVEPYDGLVGQDTAAYHNDYLRANWIGFRLDDNNRYTLLGDPRYFYLENPPAPRDAAYRKELEAHYAEQQASIEAARKRFAEYGVLYSSNRYAPDARDFSREKPCNLVDQLGGSVGWGNWSGTSDFPVDDSDPDDIRPIGPDGARFRFVAGVTGWEYRAAGADWILLFYEPVSRVALLTFDWS
ncbi:hypothetical protein WI61_26225 [Burkholderia cepacia]|nr:hypothetical protein WI47_12040 [Burkholderia cepacia]KVA58984.1 hypothetical protein WI48_16645 [Burkholderia cepacia]KVA63586.1 hypothetical protein WI49_19985 [Burkholderia cepacia]KVA85976.1 hypothetical protein WI50_15830 [Burkholderia cepacia]KVA88460.1 hypothetical protein WI52_10375 [Burkholderia cepacia]